MLLCSDAQFFIFFAAIYYSTIVPVGAEQRLTWEEKFLKVLKILGFFKKP